MSPTDRFHEVANDSLVQISEQLWPEAKLALVVYTPEKPKLDIVLKDQCIDLNEVSSTLRRAGLSIDGDNAYKRDLCDSIVGALALGAQNTNPPPAGHWCQRFWDIGREERAMHDELLESLSNLVGLAKLGAPRLDKYHAALAHAEAVIAKANQ